jgi:serine palmitoyltransferase
LELKKKYKFYLFVDEAHSIGALGPHGRGVVDYYGVSPRSVDILMGTFTKSFGAAGGYVSGTKALMSHIRLKGHSGPYAEAMSPPVLTQIISSMASIMGVSTDTKPSVRTSTAMIQHPGPVPSTALPGWMDLPPTLADGTEGRIRLRRLAFNARYLSRGLDRLGFITYGHDDSPIVPLMIYHPGKMATFSRMMRERSTPIYTVVVAYPATTLVTARVRFCLSSAHTKEDVDLVLKACDEIGELLDLKHGKGERWPLQQIMDQAVELVNMKID